MAMIDHSSLSGAATGSAASQAAANQAANSQTAGKNNLAFASALFAQHLADSQSINTKLLQQSDAGQMAGDSAKSTETAKKSTAHAAHHAHHHAATPRHAKTTSDDAGQTDAASNDDQADSTDDNASGTAALVNPLAILLPAGAAPTAIQQSKGQDGSGANTGGGQNGTALDASVKQPGKDQSAQDAVPSAAAAAGETKSPVAASAEAAAQVLGEGSGQGSSQVSGQASGQAPAQASGKGLPSSQDQKTGAAAVAGSKPINFVKAAQNGAGSSAGGAVDAKGSSAVSVLVENGNSAAEAAQNAAQDNQAALPAMLTPNEVAAANPVPGPQAPVASGENGADGVPAAASEAVAAGTLDLDAAQAKTGGDLDQDGKDGSAGDQGGTEAGAGATGLGLTQSGDSGGGVAGAGNFAALLAGSAGSAPAASAGPAAEARAPAAVPPPPTEQVAMNLGRLTGGTQSFSMILEPEKLGGVAVKLNVDAKGKAKATITADRPETLALLRQDAHHLVKSLQDAGVNTDANSLSFALKDQGGNHNSSGQERRGGFGAAMASAQGGLSGGTSGAGSVAAAGDTRAAPQSLSSRLYDLQA